MTKLRAASFGLLLALLPTVAAAQPFPNTFPANTVWGRLGTSSGPGQAIPFSVLGPSLITNNLAVTAPLAISGLNLSITGSAGKVLGGAGATFINNPTLGVASSATGSLTLANSGNSGTVTLQAPSTATTYTITFPTTACLNGQGWVSNGSGTMSCAATSGTVNSGTAGQLAYYATSSAAVSGNSLATLASGTLQLGASGSTIGAVTMYNATSGSVIIQPVTGALGSSILSLPAATDTLVGKATTDTLTNKTLTSPTINTPTIVGGTHTAITGLGVRDTSAAFDVTIAANSASAALTAGRTLTLDVGNVAHTIQYGTTANTITFPNVASDTVVMLTAAQSLTNKTVNGLTVGGSSSTFTVGNSKTAAISNSLTFTGTDSTSFAFPSTSDTVVTLTASQTLTNKTLTSPAINTATITGGTTSALTNLGIRSTGSGAFDLVLANTENLTAQRTLTLTVNNAARLISLSGDLTLGVAFTANGSGPITINSSSSTNVTLPTTGTLATRDVANTFSATNTFSAVNQFTDVKFSSGKLYPTADSTTAMQVCKADGLTCFGTFDTTNQAATFATLKFTTLDATSLSTSTSTITGLTVNNSPNGANDYVLYYSNADSRIRKATISAITSAGVAGVSSLNGLTGGLSIVAGNGINVSAASTSVTITSTGTLIPQGRLTLTSGTPVMKANTTAVSTIYYDCYAGNQVPIYNGSIDVGMAINACEISDAVPTSSTGVANSSGVFDMWAINVSGTLTLCHATNGSGGGWASDTGGSNTARGTGYSQLDFTSRPYITNKNALASCYNGATNKGSISANQATYLGTFYTTAAGQTGMNFNPGATAGGNNPFLGLYNGYNRERTCVASYDSTSSWTTTAAAWEVANIGGTGVGLNNRVNWVDGLSLSTVEAEFDIIAATSSGTSFVSNGITFDGTGTPTGQTASSSMSATSITSMNVAHNTTIGSGLHFAQAMQKAATGKWFGVGDAQAMMVRACLAM